MPDLDVETNQLSETLKLLADPNRLDLLRQLREPKIVDEIEMTPSRASQGANPDRQLTRQAVRHHLRQLRDEDLVEVSTRQRPDGRRVSEFKVNEEAFYGVVEELRHLNEYISRSKRGRASLKEIADEAQEDWPTGPKLILVRGLHDGQVFMLNEASRDPPRGWVIGRSDGCAVQVDYDNKVAPEDTEIMPTDEGGFELIDLRSSKERTVVNGVPLLFGGKTELEHGDVAQIGSSVFVFHAK